MRPTIFLFPFAGSSVRYFEKWFRDIEIEEYKVEYVEMPGRGWRIHDDVYKSFYEAILDLSDIVYSKVGKEEISLFGHSMGAILAYNIARELENRFAYPSNVFLSGINPSKYCSIKEIQHELYQGNDRRYQIYANQRAGKMFYSRLIQDIDLVLSQSLSNDIVPIRSNGHILFGKDDSLCKNIRDWNHYFVQEPNYYEFEGGHFYFENNPHKVVDIIEKVIIP